MDPEIEEIRRLQLERSSKEGKLASLSEVSYDKDLYGGSKDDFESSIAIGGDDDDDSEQHTIQNSRQKFLNSFSAPKHVFQETFDQKEASEDVFKDFKKKTIAEREGDYQARWRKRAKLSPPRLDPYKDKKKEGDNATYNSYRDLMQDVNLEKERADVIRKIEQKKRQEREDAAKEERKQQRLKQEEIKKQKKKEKKEKKERNKSKSPSRSRSRSGSPVRKKSPKLSKWETEDDRQWGFDVLKNGTKVENIVLEPDITYTLGRGDAEIKLEHGSCSKNHAKISFINERPNIMDLNSTNGTFLNEEELTAGQWYKLSEKDIVKFACSTREYHVKCG